jgi:hypothetical protein
MARIDQPILECDRCKARTSDLKEMANYIQLYQNPISQKEQKFDLCRSCARDFFEFFMRGRMI